MTYDFLDSNSDYRAVVAHDAAIVAAHVGPIAEKHSEIAEAYAALKRDFAAVAADTTETQYLRERVQHVLDEHQKEHHLS